MDRRSKRARWLRSENRASNAMEIHDPCPVNGTQTRSAQKEVHKARSVLICDHTPPAPTTTMCPRYATAWLNSKRFPPAWSISVGRGPAKEDVAVAVELELAVLTSRARDVE